MSVERPLPAAQHSPLSHVVVQTEAAVVVVVIGAAARRRERERKGERVEESKAADVLFALRLSREVLVCAGDAAVRGFDETKKNESVRNNETNHMALPRVGP